MADDFSLKNVADQANNKIAEERVESSGTIISSSDNGIASNDFGDAAIIIGQVPSDKMTGKSAIIPAAIVEEPKAFEITDDDLKTVMPDVSNEEFAKLAPQMKQTLSEYRKRLIINSGFTPEEADEATKNKLNKDGKEANAKYLEVNPNLGIVEVNKSDAEKLAFTPEEQDKLTRAKAIKLVVVENKDLDSISIRKIDKNQKVTYLKSVEGGLSKYGVPLPILGDYVTFKGAQIIQLVSTTKYNDDHIEDLVAKKASLVYDRMYGGTIFNKFGEKNKVEMTYADFANTFKFHDLNLAMYAILVASSMEESESTLSCPACNTNFQWKYNLKSLLKMDNISTDFKDRIDTILGNRNDAAVLQSIHDKNYEVKRYKSPFTNNIYDVSYPSVARVISLFGAIDQTDETMTYLSALGIFISTLYVYEKDENQYIQIDDDEVKTMMEVLQSIPQADIDLLFNQIKDMVYEPEFVLESKCPNCGERMTNKLSIDDLIFLSAQDIGAEIR
jgi:hypothetical protein